MSTRTFDRLHPALQHHIVNSLGWRELRAVQDVAIEAILGGENAVVLAPTAGGKTEAAFFPLISETLREDLPPISVLYVSPIKALLNNQEYRLRRYYELVGRRVAVWHGDTTASERKRILAEPPDALLTTPESLEVLLVSTKVRHVPFFRNVQAVVVDEVHAFAGDDRGWHLLSLISRISRIAGRDIQRIGLSATVGNPEFLVDWLSAGSSRARRVIAPDVEVSGDAPPRIELDYVGTLANAARVIAALHRGEKRLVFIDSRARVEALASELRALEVKTFVSHSSLGIDERRQAEKAFAEGQDCVIVATSTLELGIDVGDLDRVIQIDAPATVSSFLQRMGRTGRRPGTLRNCLFLATTEDAFLRAAGIIELWREGYIEPIAPPPEPLHILAQQVMALALQEQGIGRREWFDWVRAVPAFADLPPARVEDIVAGMLERRILWEDSGLLSMGQKGEEEFGRRNFLDLFAVFSAPPLFTVFHGKHDLGSVHQSSFLVKEREPIVLLLGGRSWKVKHIDWKRRTAHVEATDERGRSRWMGEGQMLSYRLCRAIRRELLHAGDRDYWTERARRQFAEIRESYGWLAPEGKTTLIVTAKGGIEWWTFAGGRANATLADEFRNAMGRETAWDNFHVRIKGQPGVKDVVAAIEELAARPAESFVPEVDDRAIEGLKFQECLSREVAVEVLRERLADPDGVRGSLGEVVSVMSSAW